MLFYVYGMDTISTREKYVERDRLLFDVSKTNAPC
jgi:hypothetical protein